jgi:6-phosphogluconolactonase (cycloisomerase 2 family)
MRIHRSNTARTAFGRIIALSTLLTVSLIGCANNAQAQGAVFTSTNSAFFNSVLMFHRAANGALTPVSEFFTGGVGTGAGLGNAGAVILSPNNRWLFTVNAASNTISVFAVQNNELVLVDCVPSGGTLPVSLTVFGNWLYVVNSGSAASSSNSNITGFTIASSGHLTPIPNSTQTLSVPVVKPGQIKFSPFGDLLVVTEQTTNTIDVFPIASNGAAEPAIVTPSEGPTPFGFDFDVAGHLLVSEAGTNSASSYYASTFGILPISAAVANAQNATCWLVTNSTFAWTANASSDDISGYKIAPSGQLSLIQPNSGVAVHLATGFHTTDEAVDGHGHLYALSGNTGSVAALGINANGTLTILNITFPFSAGMSGIAAE